MSHSRNGHGTFMSYLGVNTCIERGFQISNIISDAYSSTSAMSFVNLWYLFGPADCDSECEDKVFSLFSDCGLQWKSGLIFLT